MVKAGEVIIEVKAQIDDLQKGMKQVKKEITELKESSKKTQGGIDDLGMSFKGFNTVMLAAKGLIAGVAVKMAVDFVQAMAKAQETVISFNVSAGKQADILLGRLRSATRGYVSDLQLMATANKSAMLGISSDNMVKLAEVATAKAKFMGISVTQAFDDISIGIARQSRMILDNLGIIIDFDKAYKEYAATIGKTASSLSELEKQTAVVNMLYNQNKGMINAVAYATEGMNTELQKATASLNNIKNEMLGGLAEGFNAFVGNTQSMYGELYVFPEYRDQVMELSKEIYTLTMQENEAARAANALGQAFTNQMAVLFPGESENQKAMLDLRRQLLDKEKDKAALETAMRTKGIDPGGSDRLRGEDLKTYRKYQKDVEDIELLQSKLRELQLTNQEYGLNREELDIKAQEALGRQVEDMKTQELKIQNIATQWMEAKKKVTEYHALAMEKSQAIIDLLTSAPKDMTTNWTVEAYLHLNQVDWTKGTPLEGWRLREGSTHGVENGNPSPEQPANPEGEGNWSTNRHNYDDFMWRPGEGAVNFSKDDTIFGIKDPSSLKGGGITVNITGDIYGLDPDDIASALQTKLNSLITI